MQFWTSRTIFKDLSVPEILAFSNAVLSFFFFGLLCIESHQGMTLKVHQVQPLPAAGEGREVQPAGTFLGMMEWNLPSTHKDLLPEGVCGLMFLPCHLPQGLCSCSLQTQRGLCSQDVLSVGQLQV